MTRGIVYVAWGEKWLREACNSSRSARALGYRTCLMTDYAGDWSEHFDSVRSVDFSPFDGLHPLLRKWLFLTQSPFDVTCFLDSDTLLHEQIDLGFDLAERFGLAMTIAPGMLLAHGEREFIHYNAGAVFFTGKRPDLLEQIVGVARELDDSRHVGDEAPLSIALNRMGINPAVLPAVFNCVRAGQVHTRRIKIWHARGWPGTQLVSDQFGNDSTRYDFPWEAPPCPA